MPHKTSPARSAALSIALLCALSVLAAADLDASLQLTQAQLVAKTHAVYETKAMSRSHLGEDKRIIDHGVLIHYMSIRERESARVVIVNGVLYTAKGEPAPYGRANEKLNYAMDAEGNFYIFNQTGHPELRHSSFFDGGPVACAGNLEVKNGRIVKINKNSGHYSPSSKMFQNVLTELKKDGADLTPAGVAR